MYDIKLKNKRKNFNLLISKMLKQEKNKTEVTHTQSGKLKLIYK